MRIAFLTTDSREHFREYDNPKPRFGTAPTALLDGFSQLSGLEVHVISCAQKHMSSPKKIASNIWFHSLNVPKIGWLRTGYSGCVFAVRKKLKELQPDIVHGQGTERDCAISTVFSGFPFIVTLHGVMNALYIHHKAKFGSYLWCAALLERLILARCKDIICISPYVFDLMEQYKSRRWLVPNALQSFFFQDPPSARPTTNIPLILNVGVISERKRQIELLKVFQELAQSDSPFRVLFVGKCNPCSSYARAFSSRLSELRELHHLPFVHLNFLDDSQFIQLYDQASLMVHFSSEESFGLTFAESLARNLPLIASNVGSARDICQGIPTAQILPRDDFSALKTSLRSFLSNQRSGSPLIFNSSEIIASRYHPRIIASRHLEIYREVLSASSPS